MLAHFDIVLVAFPLTNGPNVKPRLAMPLVRRRIGSLPADLRAGCGGSPKTARGQGLKQVAGTPLAWPAARRDGMAGSRATQADGGAFHRLPLGCGVAR